MSNEKSLKQLLADWAAFVEGSDLPQPPAYEGPDVMMGRIVEDSRTVEPGDCFVARVRPYSNGHPYIKKAVARGAVLVVASEPVKKMPEDAILLTVPDTAVFETWLAAAWHSFPGAEMTVIGVTGTDGKTSIVNMLYEVLVAAKLKVGMISTIKAVIGDSEEPTGCM